MEVPETRQPGRDSLKGRHGLCQMIGLDSVITCSPPGHRLDHRTDRFRLESEAAQPSQGGAPPSALRQTGRICAAHTGTLLHGKIASSCDQADCSAGGRIRGGAVALNRSCGRAAIAGRDVICRTAECFRRFPTVRWNCRTATGARPCDRAGSGTATTDDGLWPARSPVSDLWPGCRRGCPP